MIWRLEIVVWELTLGWFLGLGVGRGCECRIKVNRLEIEVRKK